MNYEMKRNQSINKSKQLFLNQCNKLNDNSKDVNVAELQNGIHELLDEIKLLRAQCNYKDSQIKLNQIQIDYNNQQKNDHLLDSVIGSFIAKHHSDIQKLINDSEFPSLDKDKMIKLISHYQLINNKRIKANHNHIKKLNGHIQNLHQVISELTNNNEIGNKTIGSLYEAVDSLKVIVKDYETELNKQNQKISQLKHLVPIVSNLKHRLQVIKDANAELKNKYNQLANKFNTYKIKHPNIDKHNELTTHDKLMILCQYCGISFSKLVNELKAMRMYKTSSLKITKIVYQCFHYVRNTKGAQNIMNRLLNNDRLRDAYETIYEIKSGSGYMTNKKLKQLGKKYDWLNQIDEMSQRQDQKTEFFRLADSNVGNKLISKRASH